ncbi:hypothetical protein V2G26_017508 [Clonostachys chloroleuca]
MEEAPDFSLWGPLGHSLEPAMAMAGPVMGWAQTVAADGHVLCEAQDVLAHCRVWALHVKCAAATCGTRIGRKTRKGPELQIPGSRQAANGAWGDVMKAFHIRHFQLGAEGLSIAKLMSTTEQAPTFGNQ